MERALASGQFARRRARSLQGQRSRAHTLRSVMPAANHAGDTEPARQIRWTAAARTERGEPRHGAYSRALPPQRPLRPYPGRWHPCCSLLVHAMLVARDAGALACTSSRGAACGKSLQLRRPVAPRLARPRRVATRASLELDPETSAATEQALQARARVPPPAVGVSGPLRRHRRARYLRRAGTHRRRFAVKWTARKRRCRWPG